MHNRAGNKKEGCEINTSRRSFFRNSGAALLAGYAYTKGTGLAQTVQRPSDNYQSVTINTHEYFGDIEERLDFPKDWSVQVIQMAGHDAPVMTDQQIIQRIQSPIGTKQLRDIAAGKKTAVIAFDDLTRATPAQAVAKHIVNELNAAGIDDDHILFYAALGTHQIMSQPDTRAKLGDEVVNRCNWINHDIMHNFVDVGRTSFINRVEVGAYFYKADVRIGISGVKPHITAGYGGGAKILLPGCVSFDTIFYNHGVVSIFERNSDSDVGRGNPSVGTGPIFGNDMRTDMIEAARLAQLDFSVNIVFNGKRQAVAVYAGDVEQAHIEACRMANKHYVNATEPRSSVDIAVINRYPINRQASALSTYNAAAGGSAVWIMQNPMCLSTSHYLRQYRWFKNADWWETFYDPSPSGGYQDNVGQIIIFSQYIQKKDLINWGRRKNLKVARTWDEVLGYLEPAHRTGARVELYPYAAIQHNPVSLGEEG